MRLPKGFGAPGGQALVEFALILPVILILLIGIGDFARIYTTTITVESAVREGADYGGFQSSNWLAANSALTTAEIEHRVCAAASTLPDYTTTDVTNETCSNPVVTVALLNPDNIDCSQPVPAGDLPCTVHVGASYTFRLILGGIGVGPLALPATVPISRDSYYVVNDFPTS